MERREQLLGRMTSTPRKIVQRINPSHRLEPSSPVVLKDIQGTSGYEASFGVEACWGSVAPRVMKTDWWRAARAWEVFKRSTRLIHEWSSFHRPVAMEATCAQEEDIRSSTTAPGAGRSSARSYYWDSSLVVPWLDLWKISQVDQGLQWYQNRGAYVAKRLERRSTI